METKTVIKLLNEGVTQKAVRLSPFLINLAGDEYEIYCTDDARFEISRASLKSTVANGHKILVHKTMKAKEALGFGGVTAE